MTLSALRKPSAILVALFLSVAAFPLFAGSGGQTAAKKSAPRVKANDAVTVRAVEPGRRTMGSSQDEAISARQAAGQDRPAEEGRKPHERHLTRSRSWDGDVRSLPQTRPVKIDRPEREGPDPEPKARSGRTLEQAAALAAQSASPVAGPNPPTPAPTPIMNFAGLDFNTWGNGHPPDTVGDVGPNHFIQAINTSLGIFDKSNGNLISAFSFNTFMSQGSFGNLCDTNNFGDPVVLYDSFEDRWVITDFAFQLSGGSVVAPPGAFECFAVSKTGDPVSGGWNFYSTQVTDFLNDYPKFGVWPDGIYMAANMFGFPSGGAFAGARAWAYNKAQMYAGSPTVQVVTFDDTTGDFTLLPGNARLQSGTPPAGTPNYFLSTWQFLDAVTVFKFHVDWNNIGNSTFTGPDVPLAATQWPNNSVANAASLGGNLLDVLQIRAMMQNQYSNIGGAESLWATHTVRRGDTAGLAAPRWYQVDVTGGTVGANILQAVTWDPDGANVINRFMPSLAVNRNGDMALGYSTSSSTTKPAIKYAGRLATDPIETFSQTEQLLIQGAGTQSGLCGGSSCTRWGDYSAMSLDPDGCTFWYTNMYYAVDGLNHQTRIASFAFPGCTTVGGGGTLNGTVTSQLTGDPLVGVTVALGSRVTTTDGSGQYSFGVPAGTYATLSATFAGYATGVANNIVITDGGVTTQDLALALAPASGCYTDTTKADFLGGTNANCDLNASPDNIVLVDTQTIDQQNTNVGNSGVGINSTNWAGQTFTQAITGPVVRIDVNLFCSGCTGTFPNLTLSLRATASGLPTGADLASATIAGFNSGSGGYRTATFASPITLNAGTKYALVVRPNSNPSAGIYAILRSGTAAAGTNVYAGGDRVTSSTSGASWAVGISGTTTPGPNDAGFKVYVHTGFPASGTFTSSVKDANPLPAATVGWTTLSWTAATPTNTDVKFQAAASNSPNGPFTFVGPDNTGATFYSNGGSLANLSGRYLKYRASLTSTDPFATPTLSDVTACFQNVPPASSLAVDPATGSYGGSVNLSATLTSSSNPVSGKTVSFTLNGNPVGSGTTDGSGVAGVSNASLVGIATGTYPTGVAASFAGDSFFGPSSGSNSLTVNPVVPGAPTIGVATAGNASVSVTFSAPASDGGSPITGYTATCGAQSFGGTTPSITVPGLTNGVPVSCTVIATNAVGDSLPSASSNIVTPSPTVKTIQITGQAADGPEGNSGTTTRTWVLTKIGAQPATVPFTLTGTATYGDDYTIGGSGIDLNTGTLSFNPDNGTRTITLKIKGDTTYEPIDNETIVLTLGTPTNSFSILGSNTASTTITQSQDVLPAVSLAWSNVAESAGSALVTVTLSNKSDQAVSVDAFTTNGTAVAPGDYTAVSYRASTSNAVQIPAGSLTATFTIPIVQDSVDEENENLTVTLQNPVGATLGAASAVTRSILDDDAAPTVSISADQSLPEGNSGTTLVTFTATLSAASGRIVKVVASTTAGTATSPSDFIATPVPSVLTFNPGGPLSQTFTVSVKGDTTIEPDETFFVNLVPNLNVTAGPDVQAQVTILDDDTPPPPPIMTVSTQTGAQKATGTSIQSAAFQASKSGQARPGTN